MLTSSPQLGSSPLYFAAQENRVPVAEVLIKHGAKVDLARDVSQCFFIVQYSITSHVPVNLRMFEPKNIQRNRTCNMFRFCLFHSSRFLSNASVQMEICVSVLCL